MSQEKTYTQKELEELADERARKIVESYLPAEHRTWLEKQVHSGSLVGLGPEKATGPGPPASDQKHLTRSYEKYCPDCGGFNEAYKAPNVFCAEPGCGVPLGTTPSDFKLNPGEQKEVPGTPSKCWNCGSTKARITK